jgi:predicted ATPase
LVPNPACVAEAVPLLAELLLIPTSDRYPPLNLTPQKRKEKTLNALLAQVEGLAARQPVLMVFEDVHWIDPTTQESLDLFIDRVSALRVLMILTFRPEFTAPWVGRPQVTLLTLSRLPPRQRADMIKGVIGSKTLRREIADEIIERTDGVPLFIEELTKSVLESGVAAEPGDHYQVSGPLARLAIPASLHASLLARLDRLAPVREVAQIAAALGRQFSHELISTVTAMPEPQLDDALAQLVSAELVFQRGTPPNAEYTFKHALVQDAAYSTMLRSRRQQIHARIAVILESQFPDISEAQPQIIAQHCADAGFNDKAVGYLLKSGKQSITRGAITEAVAQLHKALNLVSSVADCERREQQELDIQITLGNALIAIKGYSAPEAEKAFARARQLCERLDKPTQLGQVLIGEAIFRLTRGELSKAEQHASEIRMLGDHLDEVRWKRAGSSLSGNACFWLGKFIDAKAHLEMALSLRDPMHRTLGISPENARALTLIHLFKTMLFLGYVDQALARRDEALAEARQGSPFSLASVLANAWFGDRAIEGAKSAQKTLRSAEEMLAISREHGFPWWLGIGTVMRGWCLGSTGLVAEGIPLIREGLAIFLDTGARMAMPHFLTILAEVYGMAAAPEEGLKQLQEAAKLVEATQERWADSELHRLQETLLLRLHRHDAAENSYRKALTVARRQSAKFWELRAALDLARLWSDQGKRTEARDLLAPIYDWFTEGFDTPVLQEAKALLEQITA